MNFSFQKRPRIIVSSSSQWGKHATKPEMLSVSEFLPILSLSLNFLMKKKKKKATFFGLDLRFRNIATVYFVYFVYL